MSVLFHQHDSLSELRECLRKNPHSLLLGDDDEAPREFFIGATPSCPVAVCSQGHGVKPSTSIDESRAEAWIGYNSKVANVDLRTCRARFVIALDDCPGLCVLHDLEPNA